jgi:hypothetical protein
MEKNTMSKQTAIPSREQILRMIQAELHAQQREDIKVQVAFVVNFDAGDPVIVNTILDPHEPFPRWKCKNFITSILERITQMEKSQMKVEPVSDTPTALPEIAASTIPIHTAVAAPVVL